MNDMIIVGDKVSVHFSTHRTFTGVVTYIPAATGDSWHITTEDGDVIYVQQFDYILKLSDA